jgi:hypothetical protein
MWILTQRAGGASERYRSSFEHIGPVGKIQRPVDILFNEQNCYASTPKRFERGI